MERSWREEERSEMPKEQEGKHVAEEQVNL